MAKASLAHPLPQCHKGRVHGSRGGRLGPGREVVPATCAGRSPGHVHGRGPGPGSRARARVSRATYTRALTSPIDDIDIMILASGHHHGMGA